MIRPRSSRQAARSCSTTSWRGSRFDHDKTKFPLRAAHRAGELRRDLPELQIAELALFTEAMKRVLQTPPAEYAEIINANLGKTQADPQRLVEWELGKNQCAASKGDR